LNSQAIVKSGAIFSTVGVVLLSIFALVLLAYPVLKVCQRSNKECEFSTSAPEPLKFVVKPLFLVVAILTIALGVIIFRVGTWYNYRRIANVVNVHPKVFFPYFLIAIKNTLFSYS
jgi:hypothetical protein